MEDKVMDTQDYVFGANILENLTTGMYQDSKVIYREYIQNACDQIDKAVSEKLLAPGEGTINIWLDRGKRNIIIEDNATGIPAEDFKRVLGNIADSDKKIGEDKGFRGIGRLCGLAYCEQLEFMSTAAGEDVVSIMTCDAAKMRILIDENARGIKHTANEVLHAINSFTTKNVEECGFSVDSHLFRVTMLNINKENTDLLDFQQVKDYLSFVAPVPYQSNFYYRSEIYNHAKALGFKIDEYNIFLNGEAIFKKYTTVLKDSNGNKLDDIFGVYCHDFFNADGKLIAWMWVGLSKFTKAIPKNNKMRGLRLRKENIQIGGEDALQKLFKEDRGNSYFIGEVFAVDPDLIPNSQRDYFNENPARFEFEIKLRMFFAEELHRIYHSGSTLNANYKKIDMYEQKRSEFKAKAAAGNFIDDIHREREYEVVLKAKEEAETAMEKIERLKNKASDSAILPQVIKRIEDDRRKPVPPPTQPDSPLPPKDAKHENVCGNEKEKSNTIGRRVDKLTQYSRKERKLISRIWSIIITATDSETAEMLISKIEEALMKQRD